MRSFRFQFIDIDSSITMVNTASVIKGYIVCRAPKGTTEAMYFAPGSETMINAMVGVQTAHWPDIYEAIQFNAQYGLYISAPPGTSSDYPSYYGGVYLTTKGQFKFWHEQDLDNLSYTIQVYPGEESVTYDSDCTDSSVKIALLNSIETNGAQGAIKISNISASMMQKISYLTFSAWTDTSTNLSDGDEVQYHLSNNKIYCVVDDVDTEDAVGFYQLENNGTYTIYIGYTAYNEATDLFTVASNTASTQKVPYIDFTKLINYVEVADNSSIDDITCDEYKSFKGDELINYLLLNGTGSKLSIKSADGTKSVGVSPFTGLLSRFFFNVNLKSETFLALAQKSCYETPTSITISNIGYDKYNYDLNVPYILESTLETIRENAKELSKYREGTFIKDLIAANADGLICGIKTTATDDSDPNNQWLTPVNTEMMTIWQYSVADETFRDVTSTYVTKTMFLEGALMNSVTKLAWGSNATVDAGCKYTLWYIESAGKAEKYKNQVVLEEEGGTYEPVSNIKYNTLTISCKEEVYPGEYTSGGEFTGSLSETGVDGYGSNIYWPNILPTDTVGFLEVIPVHTFDELGCINENGFFIEKRIIDPVGPAQDSETFTIVGQRYCKKVNDDLVKAGTLGGAWTGNYEAIINEGLTECQSIVYDDAYVIMEPTGQETFKNKLMTLRTTYHDLSTVISPKIITQAELSSPSTITVAGRSKGTAQYVGEFKLYDSYTGKYWWCQPIGDIGAMLCRIIDKKLGGISPYGTNDSNGLGGVLGRSVLAAKWKFQESTIQILDSKGLNAITYDADNGLMIQSGKSTQDPATLSDWSYLGHSMSFDLCKREIRDNVMLPQIGKRISPYYFDLRTKQVQAILDKRTTGTDPIWASATVDITGQNNGTTKAARQFVMKVTCKVYVFSEEILLIFENLGQEA